jgi:hypothetical protein
MRGIIPHFSLVFNQGFLRCRQARRASVVIPKAKAFGLSEEGAACQRRISPFSEAIQDLTSRSLLLVRWNSKFRNKSLIPIMNPKAKSRWYNKPFMPMSSRLWIFEGSHGGQASRLTTNDLRSQAGRLRYIPEAQK